MFNSGDKYWGKKKKKNLNYWGVKPAAAWVSQHPIYWKWQITSKWGSVVQQFPCAILCVQAGFASQETETNTVVRFRCDWLSVNFQHCSWQDKSKRLILSSRQRRAKAEGKERAKTFESNCVSSIFFSELDQLQLCASALREIVLFDITVSEGSGWAWRKPRILLVVWPPNFTFSHAGSTCVRKHTPTHANNTYNATRWLLTGVLQPV